MKLCVAAWCAANLKKMYTLMTILFSYAIHVIMAGSLTCFTVSSGKVQQLSLFAIFSLLLRNWLRLRLTEIQLKTTNKGSLVLVWMMATLEPIPATYGHRAWLRAHKCYSPWTLCQPMAHRINGQFRAGGQACPQHYMAWVNRAQRQRNNTPHIKGHSQPGVPFLGKMSKGQLDNI